VKKLLWRRPLRNVQLKKQWKQLWKSC
jgi:hypothetical protein